MIYSKGVHVGVAVNKVALGQAFLSTSIFPVCYHSTNASYSFIKHPGYSPPSSSEVKNKWHYTFPCIPSWHVQRQIYLYHPGLVKQAYQWLQYQRALSHPTPRVNKTTKTEYDMQNNNAQKQCKKRNKDESVLSGGLSM
jgi:hypothetical protein